MKRRFTILLAALLLSCGLGWAQTRTEVTDVLNRAFTGVTGTTYTEWSGKTSNSDAVYAGLSAGGNDAIQLRVKNNNEGIVTTASGGMVTKVAVVWNSNTSANRQISVWGKNTAYTSAANLFNTSDQGTYLGTLTYGTDQSTELTISDEYTFLGIRSVSGALYLDEIDITWEDGAATTDPTITVSPMTINAPAGGLDGNFTVTCANVDDPYVLDVTYFTSDGTALNPDASPDWISYSNLDTENATSIGYYIDANTGAARTAYLKIQCMVNGAPIVESGVITINQATILSNIAALTALTDAGNYEVTLTDAVVTYVNGNYAYIQDASGAVLYYKNGHGLTAGGVLNGTATVAYQVRNSNPQITDLTGVTPVSGTAPNPTQVAASAWNYTFGNVLSQYFKVTGATITQSSNKYYVSLGGEDIQLYKASGSISDLDLNKTYSITGFPTMYNTTKELQIFDNPEVEVTTEPSITVTPMTVNASAEGVDGNFNVTCDNVGNPYVLDVTYYASDGIALSPDASPDWISYGNLDTENATSIDYYIDANTGAARTAYIKIQCMVNGAPIVESEVITINQEAYVAPTYAELPFSFNGGKADIEGTDGLYQEGLGSDYSSAPKLKFDGTGDWLLLQFDERPGTLTFDIKGNSFSGGTFSLQTSEDGVTFTTLKNYTNNNFGDVVYSEAVNNVEENVRYIKWVYTEKVSGNVGLGNIELAKYGEVEHTITLSPELIEVGAEGGEGGLEYIVNWDNGDWATGFQFYDAQGEAVDQPNWITIVQQIGENEDYHYTIAANEGEARSAYFKAYTDEEGTTLYSNLVTVNQAAAVTPVTGNKYVKVTSNADLTSGQYLIIYDEGSVAFDGSLETLDATNNTINVTIENVEIEVTDETAASEFTIDMTAGTIKSASGLYIGQNSDANGMQASAEIAYTNTISIVNEGDANIVSSGGAYLRFNSASNQNRFRYYKSSSYIGQKAIQLYKKVGDEPATETYTLTIDGYVEGNVGGYHLIASPVTVDPSTNGMTEGNFDLYYFNQAEQDEWRNWKEAEGGHFNLVPGTGYLYAKQATTDNEVFQFTLTGTPYEGDGTVMLTKLEGVDWSGLNLVGNPFNEIAYIDREFYTMNGEGNEIISATNNSIQAMEGIFVYAETDDEAMQFSTEVPTETGEKIIINVTRNRGNVIDRAIVSFGQGGVLPKFQLNPNSTKLYMTEGNQEFAVVRSANEGELPVSFKASENGNYTLNIETENVEVSYLHLIDNKTGVDTDLLATPSYTFEANTTDYANRFKLVFTTGSSTGSDTFAYFNGNEWVINNEGEATLQVVDVTGRVLSSEQINGSYNNSLNLSAGVYVLRLNNGNTVKTQKIVID